MFFYKLEDFNINDEYNIKFRHSFKCSINYYVSCYLADGSGNNIATLFDKYYDKVDEYYKYKNVDFNFTLSNLGVSSNSGYQLVILISYPKGYDKPAPFYISDIELINLDDDNAFFDGIWGTIKHIWLSIIGGTCDDEGCDYTTVGLFGKLKEGFDSISADLYDLKEKITNKLYDVKTGIVNAINSIKNWLNELGYKISNKLNDVKLGIVTVIENIKEDLKSLFTPSDDYFEGYKNKWMTFAEDHLGLVYQVTDITVTLVKQVQNIMLSDSYIFTFPAIKVPINGVTYTFLEEQQVNIDMWIKGNSGSAAPAGLLYDVYTVCVWALFVFALIKYATKVEGNIFGVGGDEE